MIEFIKDDYAINSANDAIWWYTIRWIIENTQLATISSIAQSRILTDVILSNAFLQQICSRSQGSITNGRPKTMSWANHIPRRWENICDDPITT